MGPRLRRARRLGIIGILCARVCVCALCIFAVVRAAWVPEDETRAMGMGNVGKWGWRPEGSLQYTLCAHW